MKNKTRKTRTGILMVAMLTTLLSFASDVKLFTIKNEAEKTELTLLKVKKGNLLSIKNNNGIVVFKESLKENDSYKKEFDLTVLPDGAYVFELDKGLTINIIPFNVKNNLVTFNKKKETTIYKPLVRVKDDTVYISKLALNGAPLKLEVYFTRFNSDNVELMFKKTLEDPEIIKGIYKLSGLGLGTYKIKMFTEGRTFTEYIN